MFPLILLGGAVVVYWLAGNVAAWCWLAGVLAAEAWHDRRKMKG